MMIGGADLVETCTLSAPCPTRAAETTTQRWTTRCARHGAVCTPAVDSARDKKKDARMAEKMEGQKVPQPSNIDTPHASSSTPHVPRKKQKRGTAVFIAVCYPPPPPPTWTENRFLRKSILLAVCMYVCVLFFLFLFYSVEINRPGVGARLNRDCRRAVGVRCHARCGRGNKTVRR